MSHYDYDLFVIGAGSGGTRAARGAALAGARVAIAEDYRIGGTCVIRGCVPKKLFMYAAEFGQAFHDAKGFGWTVDWARFDWLTLRENVQDEVTRLSSLYRNNLEAANVAILEERALITGPHGVRVGARDISAERILVATGSRTTPLALAKGAEHVITSADAFLLRELPSRVLIAGGGYIAVEFASIFAGLGVETTLVYRGETILRGFDDDVRAFMQEAIALNGIAVVTGAAPIEIEAAGQAKLVTLSDGKRFEVDQVMAAIGRSPNTEAIGLENAAVRLGDRGAISVDPHSRTNVASIFAVGDVTDRINLTPVAIREAQAFVDSEFHGRPTAFDHADVPHAVFGRPPVAAVGLTEMEAKIRFGDAHVYKAAFRPMKHILAGNAQKMFMKLVVHPRDERVVGVHIVGPDAPEMIQLAAIAVKAELTKSQWDATCAIHPTAAEELVLLRHRTTD
jgi:glutathione reductase (NADPH)